MRCCVCNKPACGSMSNIDDNNILELFFCYKHETDVLNIFDKQKVKQ
jgi:hypothetical protein